jgi:uncharacterized protein
MYNPYIVIPFTAWVLAQTIKFANSAWRGRVDFRNLYGSGGMPSGHSAMVSSLAATALILEGFASPLFGVTVVFAAVVMYDSFGVRRSSGEQATALNVLIARQAPERAHSAQPAVRRLREVLGHSPQEVAAGAAIGALAAAIFNLDRLRPVLEWLAAIPVRWEMIAYLAVFGVLVAGSAAIRVGLFRRYRNSVVVKALVKRVFNVSQGIGWPGLVVGFGQYEKAPYLSWRLWSLLLLTGLVIWGSYIAVGQRQVLPAALEAEKDRARRQKWLMAKGKRKKSR